MNIETKNLCNPNPNVCTQHHPTCIFQYTFSKVFSLSNKYLARAVGIEPTQAFLSSVLETVVLPIKLCPYIQINLPNFQFRY